MSKFLPQNTQDLLMLFTMLGTLIAFASRLFKNALRTNVTIPLQCLSDSLQSLDRSTEKRLDTHEEKISKIEGVVYYDKRTNH